MSDVPSINPKYSNASGLISKIYPAHIQIGVPISVIILSAMVDAEYQYPVTLALLEIGNASTLYFGFVNGKE
jgi:hypothetical protein